MLNVPYTIAESYICTLRKGDWEGGPAHWLARCLSKGHGRQLQLPGPGLPAHGRHYQVARILGSGVTGHQQSLHSGPDGNLGMHACTSFSVIHDCRLFKMSPRPFGQGARRRHAGRSRLTAAGQLMMWSTVCRETSFAWCDVHCWTSCVMAVGVSSAHREHEAAPFAEASQPKGDVQWHDLMRDRHGCKAHTMRGGARLSAERIVAAGDSTPQHHMRGTGTARMGTNGQ